MVFEKSVCVCVRACVRVCSFFPKRWRMIFTHHVKSYSELPVYGARQVDGLTCLLRWMDQIPHSRTPTHYTPTSLSSVSLNETPAELPLGITSRRRH